MSVALSIILAAITFGLAPASENVRPKIERELEPIDKIQLELAKGEHEAVQLLIKSTDDLKDVSVNAIGGDFAAFVKASPMGYVKLVNKPEYFNKLPNKPTLGWWPDPILTFLDKFDVVADDVQSVWIDVASPREIDAGTREISLEVMVGGEVVKTIPLLVKVRDFKLDVVAPIDMGITFSPGSHQVLPGHYSRPLKSERAAAKERNNDPEGPVMLWEKHKAEWTDFLADHFITIDSLYLGDGLEPYFDMLERLRDQGRINRFNLGYWSYPESLSEKDVNEWIKDTIPRLHKAYDRALELGIADRAYIYGCDEITDEKFELIAKAIEILHKEFPGVQLLTTAVDESYGEKSVLKYIDAFCPRTDNYYSDRADEARKRGNEVWWYICCYPHTPYANMFIESRAIEGRLLMGVMTEKFHPDGFLYYQTSVWNSRRPITFGPYTDWEPRSWSLFNNGDGAWTCCGPDGTPLTTQRLENFRDGVEDLMYCRLAKSLGIVVDIPDELVKSLTEYSDDYTLLEKWRHNLGDRIEAAIKNKKEATK